MSDKQIQGVIVPMLTPLNSDETVDVPSLRSLVNYLIDNGVHGIWASGTTGEFANLPDSERVRSMEAVVDEVAGRVPVIGNISSVSTQLSVTLAQEVSELGMDGIALTPPYYYPDSQDELMDHYRYTRDSVGVPLWVYNIPQTVKTAVEPSTIAALAAEGTVVGVKDSSGAGELLAQLNVLCDQGEISLLRFLGTTFRVTNAGSVGVHGVIPGYRQPDSESLRARMGGRRSWRHRHRSRVQRPDYQVSEGGSGRQGRRSQRRQLRRHEGRPQAHGSHRTRHHIPPLPAPDRRRKGPDPAHPRRTRANRIARGPGQRPLNGFDRAYPSRPVKGR